MIRPGVDLVSISRIKKALEENGESFLKKICTENERARLRDEKRKTEKVAAVFGLKEAFSKALGTGLGEELSFQDLEVTYEAKGRPVITYQGQKIPCSVSHEGDLLVAFVLLDGSVV